MQPNEMDTLKELLAKFERELATRRAPGSIRAHANSVNVAINWIGKVQQRG